MSEHIDNPIKLRSFQGLFTAQLLGAFNDNFFKMVVSLIAIDVAANHSGGYLSLIAVVFILPYLLFSGYAGAIADKYRKRSVLIAGKGLEVVVMTLALAALALGNIDFMLFSLFLLATQATFFSPAKYGILSEILPVSALQRANGLLEMSRYGAVIAGTAIGGIAIQWLGDNPAAIGVLLVAIALAGCVASLFIRVAPNQREISPHPVRLNPWSEIGRGLRLICTSRRMIAATAGLTLFEGLGALALPIIILIGDESLGLDEAETSLLPAFAGIGLVAGSFLAGRWSQNRVETGMVPVGLVGVSGALVSVPMTGDSYAALALVLFFAGLSGGLIFVPLNTALQYEATDRHRGQVIASNNFLNMSAVLLCSATPWFFCDLLRLSPELVLLGAGAFLLAMTSAVLALSPAVASHSAAWIRLMMFPLRAPRFKSITALTAIGHATLAWAHQADTAQFY